MTLYQVIKASGWEERREGNEIIVKKIEREMLQYIIYFFWLTKRGTWEKEGRWEDKKKAKTMPAWQVIPLKVGRQKGREQKVTVAHGVI